MILAFGLLQLFIMSQFLIQSFQYCQLPAFQKNSQARMSICWWNCSSCCISFCEFEETSPPWSPAGSTMKPYWLNLKNIKHRKTSYRKLNPYLVTWWRTGTKDWTSPNPENLFITPSFSISKGRLLMKVVLCKSSSLSVCLRVFYLLLPEFSGSDTSDTFWTH